MNKLLPHGFYKLKLNNLAKIGDRYYCGICSEWESIDKDSFLMDMTVENIIKHEPFYSNFCRKITRGETETNLNEAKWE